MDKEDLWDENDFFYFLQQLNIKCKVFHARTNTFVEPDMKALDQGMSI